MEELKSRSRKRVSKKRKSAWRKHSQVKEVDEYFKNKRIEERLGFANDEDIEDLFTTGDSFADTAPKRIKTSKDNFKLKSHFPPSLDDHIKPIRNPVPNKTKAVTEPKIKVSCHIKVKVEDDEVEAEEDESKVNVFDMWGAPKSSGRPKEDFNVHGKMVCKVTRVKPPSHFGKKPNEIPAIPVPMPGTSYHPSSKDHEELIKSAYDVEMARIARETRITNATDKMFPTKGEAPTEATWLKEMSQGLPIPGVNEGEEEEEEEEDDEEEDDDAVFKISHNPPVRREDKKTEKERKKMKERKLEERKVKAEKEKKTMEAEKFKINSSKKRILQEELKRAIRRSWRRFDAEEKKNVPKKLGRIRFREPDLDLKLSDEMTDSLRRLKPEGHILKDLVTSIQRRNMAPATGKGEPKKRQRRYKPKVFEKQGHKNITL